MPKLQTAFNNGQKVHIEMNTVQHTHKDNDGFIYNITGCYEIIFELCFERYYRKQCTLWQPWLYKICGTIRRL